MLCRPVVSILWIIPTFFILVCPESLAARSSPSVTYGAGDSVTVDENAGTMYIGPDDHGDQVVRVRPPRQPEQMQPVIPYIIPQVDVPWPPNNQVQPRPDYPGPGGLPYPPGPSGGYPQPPYPYPGQPGWRPHPPYPPVYPGHPSTPPGNLQPPVNRPPAVMPPAMRPPRPPMGTRPPQFVPPPAGQRPPVPPPPYPSRPPRPMPPGGAYDGPQFGFPLPPPNSFDHGRPPRVPSRR